ncbi:MAG: glycosyltransferase [Gammaproteobacteria bacterium]
MTPKLLTYSPPSSLCFVSTYVPTRCGLATFTHSLITAIGAQGYDATNIGVMRIEGDRQEEPSTRTEVVGQLNPSCPLSRRTAAARLDDYDVAIIQHEFGVYGPDDGIAVLDVLERISAPTIVVLHTVLTRPSDRQRSIVERIAALAGALVVMSSAAKRQLERHYRIDQRRVHVIPHGAHGYRSTSPSANERPVVLTWGLIGPGKGIERGIEALAYLKDLEPKPIYRIAGQTHPNVLRLEGERYRHGLLSAAKSLGVSDMIDFRNEYLNHEALERLVTGADIVLLPYDSREQVTSGVLIDAIAALKPVVATRFPHATELLASGGGLLVPHEDPAAMAGALRQLLTEPVSRQAAISTARQLASSLAWSSIGQRYEALAESLSAHQASAVA